MEPAVCRVARLSWRPCGSYEILDGIDLHNLLRVQHYSSFAVEVSDRAPMAECSSPAICKEDTTAELAAHSMVVSGSSTVIFFRILFLVFARRLG